MWNGDLCLILYPNSYLYPFDCFIDFDKFPFSTGRQYPQLLGCGSFPCLALCPPGRSAGQPSAGNGKESRHPTASVRYGFFAVITGLSGLLYEQVTSANVAIPCRLLHICIISTHFIDNLCLFPASLNVQFVVGTPNGSSSASPAKSESNSTATDSKPTASIQTGSILGGLTPQSQFQ